jgi:predicted TPR repeat methyltransferase
MPNITLKEAQQLHQSGQLDQALCAYQALLEQDPNQPVVYHWLTMLFVQKSEFRNALSSINLAIEHLPNEAALYNSKGNIYLKLNDLTKAKIAYNKAIEINPSYPIAYNNLGNIAFKQNDNSEALKLYTKALSLDPNYIDAGFNQARAHAEEHQWKEAQTVLHKLLENTPDHSQAMGLLAQYYLYQCGDATKAIPLLKQRLGLQPQHGETHQNLGIALLKNNEPSDAILHFEEAAAIDPSLEDIYYQTATTYLQLQEQDNALKNYLRQIQRAPSQESYYNAGVLFSYKDHYKEALEYLTLALKLDENHLPTRLNIAAIHLKNGKLNDAIKQYEEILLLDPDNIEVNHTLAALRQEGIPDKAPAEFLKLLFDQYAGHYEQHLSKYLEYQVPQKIYHSVIDEANAENPQWRILDLGCGTGLCGDFFTDDAKTLVGIDISAEMIAIAKSKDCYTSLIVGDIEEELPNHKNMDIVLAADVFTYIGKLDTIFARIVETLNPGGLFAFSVEQTQDKDFTLQRNIRYAHNKQYIEQLAKQNNLLVLQCYSSVLRKQQSCPVEGLLFLLQKTK